MLNARQGWTTSIHQTYRYFVFVPLFMKPIKAKYRKILKISAGAYIIQRPFLRGLSTEGNCISKSIGLASKFTVFALFTLYLKAIFQVQAPRGLIFGGAI